MIGIRHINFIGAGNVASNLGAAFVAEGYSVNRIFAPSKNNREALAAALLANAVDDIHDVQHDCDLIVIAVPDDSIAEVSKQLFNEYLPVVHTSGSVSTSEAFGHTKLQQTGVLYPLQTLVSISNIDFSEVPICVEANEPKLLEKLSSLAASISNSVHVMDSSKRLYLHLAAVMVNNFSFFLYNMAAEKLREKQLDFSILKALARQTVENAFAEDSQNRQTGPASRNDERVLRKHVELLKDDPEMQEVYQMLSEKIRKKFMKKQVK